jgi:hypothetical protein
MIMALLALVFKTLLLLSEASHLADLGCSCLSGAFYRVRSGIVVKILECHSVGLMTGLRYQLLNQIRKSLVRLAEINLIPL